MKTKKFKKPRKIINEFKTFALRGNVIDLAIGVIIGASLQTIVRSLVEDIIMPLVGWMFGNYDFSNSFIILGNIPTDVDASKLTLLSYVKELQVPIFAYGKFITVIITFLITAFAIFWMVKFINKLREIVITPTPPEDPTEKDCPLCCTKIPIHAVKCPNCTGDINNNEE